MSFRQFGGLQFASKHNAVASYYNTTGNLLVTQNVGQPNSYITFLSDISGNITLYGNLDVSGNINVSGDVDISGNLHVQQDIDCSGNVNIDGDVDINGNLHVQQDIDCSGNVNIDGDVDINGNVNATSYNSSSDYRIKENVTQLDGKFIVDNLNPVTYLNNKLGKQDIGLIAHELQEIYPELVNGEKDGEQLQSVNYIGLIPVLIKEIQELKKEIKSIKEELNELKNK
jgi:cytoskeletal protein CcmA (bactofilin family)